MPTTSRIDAVFILELSYIAPLDEVDPVRDEHMAWVATQYEAGWPPCVENVQIVSPAAWEQSCNQRVDNCFADAVTDGEDKHTPE